MTHGRAAAVVVQGTAGAALAAATTALAPEVVMLVAAAVGGVNGVLAATLSVYGWRTWRGWVAFFLDHTWGLLGTALAALLQVVNVVWPSGGGYVDSLSRGQNRYAYDGGFGFGRYAFTQGPVMSNLHGSRGNLIDHETLHIWQSRVFGPVFQLSYVAWLVTGALVATCLAPFARQSWSQTLTDIAYLDNPWETWAYRVGGRRAGGRFSWGRAR